MCTGVHTFKSTCNEYNYQIAFFSDLIHAVDYIIYVKTLQRSDHKLTVYVCLIQSFRFLFNIK